MKQKILSAIIMLLTAVSANAQKPGVYIMDTQGYYWTTDDWKNASTPNAIALVTPKVKILIALEDATPYEIPWGPSGNVNDVVSTMNNGSNSMLGEEWADVDGASNTKAMIRQLPAQVPGTALEIITEWRFPDGTEGYIPAIGEMFQVFKNIREVNRALAACGGQTIPYEYYWTSTQHYLPYRIWTIGKPDQRGRIWFANLRHGKTPVAHYQGGIHNHYTFRLRPCGTMPKVIDMDEEEEDSKDETLEGVVAMDY